MYSANLPEYADRKVIPNFHIIYDVNFILTKIEDFLISWIYKLTNYNG